MSVAAQARETTVKFRAKDRNARRTDEGDDEEPVTPVGEANPVVPANTPAVNDAAKRRVVVEARPDAGATYASLA